MLTDSALLSLTLRNTIALSEVGTLRSQKKRGQQHTNRPATENCQEKIPLRKEIDEGVSTSVMQHPLLSCHSLLILHHPTIYLRPPNMKEHSSWYSLLSEHEENLRDEQQGKAWSHLYIPANPLFIS